MFFLPAAAHTEKDGTFTNTQRLLQWHHKAVEPPGDCRSELHWIYHLGQRIREKLADSDGPEGPRRSSTSPGTTRCRARTTSPTPSTCCRRSTAASADGSFLASYDELATDGSTTCGSWIHCGIYTDGVNQSARKKPHTEQNWIAPEWGWAWPKDRRIIYNRASADPDGKPVVRAQALRVVGRRAGEVDDASATRRTSRPTKAPDYVPPDDAKGMEAIRGDKPFILHPDGLGWLYAPTGLVDGPLPTHYEPQETPFTNPLYAQQQNPTRQVFHRPENPYHPSDGEPGADVFPFVLTTYRLTEHHTAGGMSRTVPVPGRAAAGVLLRGLPAARRRARARARRLGDDRHGAAAVEARVMVDRRGSSR